MPEFADNGAYLTVNGRDVGPIFRAASITASNSVQDTTAGAGVSDMKRQPGLGSHDISMTLAYNTDRVATDITNLKTGVIVRIVWGPEGNAAGKPKHEQDFIFASNVRAQSVEKTPVVFELSGSSALAPISDMDDGDTF